MQNIQPLLVSRNSAATDLSLMLSSDGRDIFAFLDTALLERISCFSERLEYKLLVGRMVNAGHRLTELIRGFHHARMVLFLVMLELFFRERPGSAPAQSQWVGQILQGAVKIEQSRMVTAGDLARFTGAVEPGIEPQRRLLRQLASPEAVADIYAANARLLGDGPGNSNSHAGDFEKK